MGCVICWVCTFIVGKFFPIAEAKLGPYVFIFFALVSLFAFLYCLKITPGMALRFQQLIEFLQSEKPE